MAAFTTVAAVAGLAATAGTTGMSFYQANKQKKLQQKAQNQANEAMAAARKKLDVNFYEQLAVKKEPYELAREASLAQGAMGIEAGREGETRGAAATAGRVQMAQNQEQGNIRTAMGQELGDIQKAVAEEDSRLRDVGVQLDLATVEGAQEAAANAAEARQQAISQGMEGLTSLVGQAASMAPLYGKDIQGTKSALAKTELTPEEFNKFGNTKIGMGGEASPGFSNLDLSAVGGMSNSQYRRFLKGLSTEQQNVLFSSPSFVKNYGQ